MGREYNWEEIQKFYDAGNSVRECMAKFGFHWGSYCTAKRNGKIKNRTSLEGTNLYYQKFGGHKHSQETKQKLSSIRKEFLKANPDKVPYKLNHYSKRISYPEKYFKEVFENEKINLKQYLQVSYYELDFYDIDKKIDVEIDGEQHYVDKRIVKSDKTRTKYLESLGWKIYRIRWSFYKKLTYEDKKKEITKLKQFIENHAGVV